MAHLGNFLTMALISGKFRKHWLKTNSVCWSSHRRLWYEITPSPFFSFLFTHLFSITFLYYLLSFFTLLNICISIQSCGTTILNVSSIVIIQKAVERAYTFLYVWFYGNVVVRYFAGTQIPDPPFSSCGPSCDCGMDLSLEVYLWAIYQYFITFRVSTLSFY